MSRGRPGLPAKVPRADKQTYAPQDGLDPSVFPGLAQALQASEGWAGRIGFRAYPAPGLVLELDTVSHIIQHGPGDVPDDIELVHELNGIGQGGSLRLRH